MSTWPRPEIWNGASPEDPNRHLPRKKLLEFAGCAWQVRKTIPSLYRMKTCLSIPLGLKLWILSRPGTEPGSLLQIPHSPDLETEFYQVDLFHAFHLGCGKYFFSSAIATLLQSDRIHGLSLPAKLATLSADLKDFCRRKHESPFITAFTVENLHLKSSKETPAAGWSKAHTTSVVMKWLEDFLKRKFGDDGSEMVQQVATRLQSFMNTTSTSIRKVFFHDIPDHAFSVF